MQALKLGEVLEWYIQIPVTEMDLTTLLTGALPAIVILSALLTTIISLLLLGIYRRAVLRSMKSGGGARVPADNESTPVPQREMPRLVFDYSDDEMALTGGAKSAFNASSRSLHRLGGVYALAGGAYALVFSLTWMVIADDGFPLVRLLWLFICYAWPTVITIAWVAATSSRQKGILFAAYFTFVAVIGAIVIARNAQSGIGQLSFFWFFVNGGATLLLATFLWRRIRAVGPLVLTLILAGVSGAVVLTAIVGNSEALLRSFVVLGNFLGVDATALFVSIHLLGFILLGMFGWWLLGRLGKAYSNKRMSDQALYLDALWLIFTVLQSFTLAFEGLPWILIGPAAFILYKIAVKFGIRRAVSGSESEISPSLLLLRVFSLGRRSERLFDGLSKRWLRSGCIDMIAGPDLVTSLVEPHEFLDFIGGRLSRSFIEDSSDLEHRLEKRDKLSDPDGRYRVNEFFCRQDTWQMCMRRLASESNLILMDLRSFSPANHGCLWELEQLLSIVALERLLLVVDESTDLSYLEQRLQHLWPRIAADSLNRLLQKPRIELFSASGTSAQVGDSLVKRLFRKWESA